MSLPRAVKQDITHLRHGVSTRHITGHLRHSVSTRLITGHLRHSVSTRHITDNFIFKLQVNSSHIFHDWLVSPTFYDDSTLDLTLWFGPEKCWLDLKISRQVFLYIIDEYIITIEIISNYINRFIYIWFNQSRCAVSQMLCNFQLFLAH